MWLGRCPRPAVLALLAVALAAAAPEQRAARIVGGHTSRIERQPWQVSLLVYGLHLCGGSIIAESVVLTAAHCIDTLYTYQVGAGSSYLFSLSLYDVVYMKVHEKFNRPRYNNDVAVMKIRGEFDLGCKMQIVPLAVSRPPTGALVTVSGWGATSEEGDESEMLRSCTIEVMPWVECQQCYGRRVITKSMLCAGVWEGGTDACQGDSGGPLVHAGRQVGVVSFGRGCGRPAMPGVYADVVALRRWITKNAGIA